MMAIKIPIICRMLRDFIGYAGAYTFTKARPELLPNQRLA